MSTPQGHLQPNKITVSSIHNNTQQTVLQITEDRLRLIFLEHLKTAESSKQWQVPLGVLLAIVPVILTSEFKDTWGIEKSTWKAFFMLGTVLALGWLIWTLRSIRRSTTIDQLVARLKNASSP